MSKSQLDGGLHCKFFLHINGSNEYINNIIQIPLEHFPGVCLVSRLSSVQLQEHNFQNHATDQMGIPRVKSPRCIMQICGRERA